jgi:hypothetical protein
MFELGPMPHATRAPCMTELQESTKRDNALC